MVVKSGDNDSGGLTATAMKNRRNNENPKNNMQVNENRNGEEPSQQWEKKNK